MDEPSGHGPLPLSESRLHQDQDGVVTTSRIQAGELIINPPGMWHSADANAPVTAVFITCGLGTELRPR